MNPIARFSNKPKKKATVRLRSITRLVTCRIRRAQSASTSIVKRQALPNQTLAMERRRKVSRGAHEVTVDPIEIQALHGDRPVGRDEHRAVDDGVRAVAHFLQQAVVGGRHGERRHRRRRGRGGPAHARAPHHGHGPCVLRAAGS